MFEDPQEVKVNGADTSTVPRTGSGVNTGEFTSSTLTDGNYAEATAKLTIQHTYGKRTRRVVRLDEEFVKDDVFNDATNSLFGHSVYLVVDTPKYGVTSAADIALAKGLAQWLTADTYANLIKFIGGES